MTVSSGYIGTGGSYGSISPDLSFIDVVFKNNIILNPDGYIAGSDVLLPYPDGWNHGGWPGIWRGPILDPLPWTSPVSNIHYLE